MTIDQLIEGKRICICCGSGGVGKTTVAAAIAMGAAAAGKKVVVITIDPAKRLADSLGLDQLGNEPRLVEANRFHAQGLELKGELWAMMLDVKQTFDELIDLLAPDAQTRDQVLSTRIYQQLSTAVAGSQEFTAIAKLYELNESEDFDLLVLDTPPSRNALDFLDAPDRLTKFFEGRALQLFLKPTGLSMRIFGRGTSLMFSLLERVTGIDLMRDLSIFFQSLSSMIGGFKDRAKKVEALLSDPQATFLLITSPQREPIDEAIYFWRKLKANRMPFGGIIVNQVHFITSKHLADSPFGLDGSLQRRVAANFHEYQSLAKRDRKNINYLAKVLDIDRILQIPSFDEDIHDIDGLIQVYKYLHSN